MDPSEKTNGTPKRTHSYTGPQYRECLRNHAASLGTHALDGCGEFFASPASPLTCSACGCHRNFHRKISSMNTNNSWSDEEEDNNSEDEAGSQVLLTLKTGAGPSSSKRKKKRFRSRFTREQKEGMMELAERVGWRLQRREEGVVEEGCKRIGVERRVFKVWMHNNKQAVFDMKKRRTAAAAAAAATTTKVMINGDEDHHKPSSSSSPSSLPL